MASVKQTVSTVMDSGAKSNQNARHPTTPFGVLQEVCVSKKLEVEYKIIGEEIRNQQPYFVARVKVCDEFVCASGQSKRIAKHCAAKFLMEKILNNNCASLSFLKPLLVKRLICMTDVSDETDTLFGKAEDPSFSNDNEVSEEESTISYNPVGQLQELCMKKRWCLPLYETQMEEGMPDERMFGVICFVNKYAEFGFAETKKLAKKEAAQKMLQRIHGVSMKQKEKVEPGSKLHILRSMNLDAAGLNLKKILRDISEEQGFEVAYISESIDGHYSCICHLTTSPSSVHFGVGESEQESVTNAFYKALQHLKV